MLKEARCKNICYTEGFKELL